MNLRRNRYGAQSWSEFIGAWALLFIGWPLCLVLLGFAFKLMWLLFKFGWGLV